MPQAWPGPAGVLTAAVSHDHLLNGLRTNQVNYLQMIGVDGRGAGKRAFPRATQGWKGLACR